MNSKRITAPELFVEPLQSQIYAIGRTASIEGLWKIKKILGRDFDLMFERSKDSGFEIFFLQKDFCQFASLRSNLKKEADGEDVHVFDEPIKIQPDTSRMTRILESLER